MKKNNKFLLVTRAYGITNMSKISHPLLKKYAERCSADFLVIDKKKINLGPFHNEIFQLYDLLDKYERIINIDSDVLIKDNTPNLFDIVPEKKIGLLFEDVGYRKWSRRNDIKKIQEKFGNINWKEGYINTGLIVVSRMHKNIFKVNPKEFWNEPGYDDVQLGYMINKHKFEIYNLPVKYNHMSLNSELGYNWLYSYIIHYSGRGFYKDMDRSMQMERDKNIIENFHPIIFNFLNFKPRLRLICLGLWGYSKVFISFFKILDGK